MGKQEHFQSSQQCVKMSQFFCRSNFYVKSRLADGESQNMYVILTHLGAQNFEFYEFLKFLMAGFYKINKIQSPYNGKTGSFTAAKFSNIDFT